MQVLRFCVVLQSMGIYNNQNEQYNHHKCILHKRECEIIQVDWSHLTQKLRSKTGYRRKDKGEMEVTGRRGRRRKKLLDDLKDRRGYSHLKEETLDRAMWMNRFGEGFELVVRQNTE